MLVVTLVILVTIIAGGWFLWTHFIDGKGGDGNGGNGGKGGNGEKQSLVQSYLTPEAVHNAAQAVTYTDKSGNEKTCTGIAFDLEGILEPNGPRGDVMGTIRQIIPILCEKYGYNKFIWVGGYEAMPAQDDSPFTHVAPMLYWGNSSYNKSTPADFKKPNYFDGVCERAKSLGWSGDQLFLTFQSYSAVNGDLGETIMDRICQATNKHNIAGVLGWPANCDWGDDDCIKAGDTALKDADNQNMAIISECVDGDKLNGGWITEGATDRFTHATCLLPGHFSCDPFIPARPINLGPRPTVRECFYTLGGQDVGLAKSPCQ
jgi:hypothetical protein